MVCVYVSERERERENMPHVGGLRGHLELELQAAESQSIWVLGTVLCSSETAAEGLTTEPSFQPYPFSC